MKQLHFKGGININSPRQLHVPKEFENFRVHLQNSAVVTSIIYPIHGKPKIYESKLAGYPYLPRDAVHPKDANGQYMLLLAQINFSEVHLGAPFPTQGLLQFYISEHCYHHAQLGTGDRLYKIRYYPTIIDKSHLISDFSYLTQTYSTDFPINSELGIQFSTAIEPVSATDYRLSYYFNPLISGEHFAVDGRTFNDLYLENFLSADHKVGGYPYFIEEDIRKNSVALQCYDTLLLQIVSNDEHGIMWGDCGVMSFFINSKKLQHLDFSDIYFHTEDY
ncbi:YwqG family protein [Solibacillus sp. FSL H8-0538]|uniref:YwqG family protein n=1 Tax=Solibacillus sp. FSL H8-0538 TaxID=2921400 RepID=UPI0030F70770